MMESGPNSKLILTMCIIIFSNNGIRILLLSQLHYTFPPNLSMINLQNPAYMALLYFSSSDSADKFFTSSKYINC